MATEKTLNDIALNQVLSTDRLESAMETNTNKIISAIDGIDASSSKSATVSLSPTLTTFSSSGIEHTVDRIDSHMVDIKIGLLVFGICVVFFMVVQVVMIWNAVTSIRSLENGTYREGAYQEYLDSKKANGSEQNTSTEEASSPQTTDQTSPQSASDEPLPQSNVPEAQGSGQ